MKDLMIDLETTGTNPDRNAVIQIAAWKFDLDSGAIDPVFFDRCLWPPAWRLWDEETRSWWGRQKREVLLDIQARMEDPRVVMKDFAEWVGAFGTWRLWAKPTTFDFMFISSYLKDFDIHGRFSYREATDLNSFLRGKYYPAPVPDVDVPFNGDVHNARWDSLYQIEVLFNHMKGGQS